MSLNVRLQVGQIDANPKATLAFYEPASIAYVVMHGPEPCIFQLRSASRLPVPWKYQPFISDFKTGVGGAGRWQGRRGWCATRRSERCGGRRHGLTSTQVGRSRKTSRCSSFGPSGWKWSARAALLACCRLRLHRIAAAPLPPHLHSPAAAVAAQRGSSTQPAQVHHLHGLSPSYCPVAIETHVIERTDQQTVSEGGDGGGGGDDYDLYEGLCGWRIAGVPAMCAGFALVPPIAQSHTL